MEFEFETDVTDEFRGLSKGAVLAVAEGQLSLVEYGKFAWVGLASFGSKYSSSTPLCVAEHSSVLQV